MLRFIPGALQKINKRDQAEDSLPETQQVLATLLSHLPGMAYRCRFDRRRPMEFVSDGCLDLTGYAPAEITGAVQLAYEQLIHPADRERVWQEIEIAAPERRSFQLTYRLVTRSGAEKWVWEQGRGVFSAGGELLALAGFITDATERIAAYQSLEQRVADRTRELATLYQVTAVASESLNLETILERSLAQVLAAMNVEVGLIHLFDEVKKELRLAAQRGLLPGDDWLPASLVEWVFEHKQPLVTPTPDKAQADRPATEISGAPWVSVPMRARGHVLGVLSLIGPAGHHFDGEAVTLLASIADQVGAAVENAQLFEAERRQRRQADTLLQVTSVVGSTLDLEEVLARILGQLGRVVSYDSASVQLLEHDKLQIIAARGFADPAEVLGATFALTEPPQSQVVAAGKALNLPDAPALYPRFRRPPFSHIRSWLGAPLRVQERIIGIIAIDRQQPGGYDEEEVRLTTAFADQAALALENARLYQQAEQLAVMEERSRLGRELHDSVTQSLYSLTLFAEVGRRSVEAGNVDEAVDYLSRLGQVAQQALREMRLLVYELRLPALETEGLVRALEQRLDAVERRAGIEARLLVTGKVELPPSVEEGLYRIAQEALNNSLKHAAASLVTVRLNASDELIELEVSDNGQAFAPEDLQTGGMGLHNMRERAERLAGSFAIVAIPGQGVTVKVSVPTRRSWSRPLLPIDRFSEVS